MIVNKKQILALMLAFIMVLGLCPVPAGAAEAAPTETTAAGALVEQTAETAAEKETSAAEGLLDTEEPPLVKVPPVAEEPPLEEATPAAEEPDCGDAFDMEPVEEAAVFADVPAAPAADWDSAVSVSLSLSHDAAYQIGPDSGVVMARLPVTVPYFDLANYGLENLYFRSETYELGQLPAADPAVYTGKVTLLHLYLFMTEVYYCGISPQEAGQGYLKTSGKMDTLMSISPSCNPGSVWIANFWNSGNGNLLYYVNHNYPLAGPGTGSTCDQVLLRKGDDVAVAHYSGWTFYQDSAMGFHYFVTDAGAESCAVTQGESLRLNIKRASGMSGPTNHAAEDKQPAVYFAPANQLPGGDPTAWTLIGNADASGIIHVDTAAMTPGNYVIAMAGGFGNENPGDVVSSPGAFRLTVKAPAVVPQTMALTMTAEPAAVDTGSMVTVAIDGSAVKTTGLSVTLTYDPEALTLDSAVPCAPDLAADTSRPGVVTLTRSAEEPFRMEEGTWANVTFTAGTTPGDTQLHLTGTADGAEVTLPDPQTVTVREAPAFGGTFHAGLQYNAYEALAANEAASVDVFLSDPDGVQQTCNAYDILLTYADGLEVFDITASGEQAIVEHDPAAHTIHVVGYGKPRDISLPLVSFYVRASGSGTYPVTRTHVKADIADGAIGSDAPLCVLDTSSVDVIVDETLVRYTVTVNGVLTDELLTGGDGVQYTWEIEPPAPGMTYKITYTMGDDPRVCKAGVTCGPTAASYTIANVTGNLNITIEQVPESPDAVITVLGSGAGDVTAPAKVRKNHGFTFTLDRKPGYTYTVELVVSGYPGSAYSVSGSTYTVAAGTVRGDVDIIVEKVPVDRDQFSVTFTGNCGTLIMGEPVAAGGEDYLFFVENDGTSSVTVKATMGGAAAAVEAGAYNDYTIRNVTGDLVIDVVMTYPSCAVTVQGTGAGDVDAPSEAVRNTDYIFHVREDPNYTYEVKVTDGYGSDMELAGIGDGAWMVPGHAIYQDFFITVNRTARPEIHVEAAQYLQMDGSSLFLITASAADAKGMAYAGQKMFWSGTYEAYCWLVSSADSLDAVVSEAKTQVTRADMPAGTIVCDGDVNKTGFVDVNDAQLTYDLYNLHYTDFTLVSMEKFLRADVNGDRTVNVSDAAAIVHSLMEKGSVRN